MKTRSVLSVLLLSTMISSGFAASSSDASRSLEGEWRFALDRADAGVAERWAEWKFEQHVHLPGTLPEQGIGDPVALDTPWTGTIFDRSFFTAPEYAAYREPGRIKVPFWLQPDKVYVGAAWYQRDIEIPAAWAGRRVVLTLERAHWQTRVWLDGHEAGTDDSLSTAHVHDFGTTLTPGPHVLTIRVDNRLIVAVGENSHSVTDSTQGNWNGIVGRLELSATAPVWIDDLQVFPQAATRIVTVRGVVRAAGGESPTADVTLALGALQPRSIKAAADGAFTAELSLGSDAALWDEFHPALHRLTATLPNGEARTVAFGLRDIATAGTQFTLNGRPLFLRGALDCCIFPRTGHPPTDVESWRKQLGTIRAHGLNHVRFHSWCPPEAAFIAGDELGMYFQVESGLWANSAPTLGPNAPAGVGDGTPVDSWLYAETERILRAYGNHPSFLLLAHGNEPGGTKQSEFLAAWVRHFRAQDNRRLYTAASGWPEVADSQFFVSSDPRVHQWGDGLKCRLNGLSPATIADYRAIVAKRSVPMIAHEIGQWSAYPALATGAKFTGPLKARNHEIFANTLATHGMADQADDFLSASGRLQVLCYKEEIESELRTPGLGGFQLLGLQDFPGQGTAPVGVLDCFWESKGYVDAAEYRRFCSETVPLARLTKRVFASDETLTAEIEVAHFGPISLAGAVAAWRLMADDGAIIARGRLPAANVATGRTTSLGRIDITLRSAPAPAHSKLVVALEGTAAENDWDVWIYPAHVDAAVPAGVQVATALDASTLASLEAGGCVLLTIPPDRVRGDARGRVELGFTPIFWNTACTQRQAPHTLGLLCNSRHPALAAFPTEAHTDWQWWYVVSRAGAMILDGLPVALRPIVQPIDDWFTNRRLGLVFEARVGRGRLLVCSIDLARDDNPVGRQLRASLLRYAASPAFAPKVIVSAEQIRSLMSEP